MIVQHEISVAAKLKLEQVHNFSHKHKYVLEFIVTMGDSPWTFGVELQA